MVSVFGVTGARDKLQDLSIRLIRRTLRITSHEGMPLAVGFGVSRPEHVRAIIENGADAAIVGSGFVRIVREKQKEKEEMLKALQKYASGLKKATMKNANT